ncbi:MAG: hypothetical protein L0Z07_09535 [Planctomycetes bacterium]|nr:hypothetical protein [Planctomycetota bacterium]
MGEPTSTLVKKPGFLHSAIWLVGCVGAVALLLMPVAVGSSGSRSTSGLLVAATICLVASFASESLGHLRLPPNFALAGLVLGMGIRMMPPLALVCLMAMEGESGRQHLAFVGYLLAFYLVTLTVGTMLAVKRLKSDSSELNSSLS